MAKVAELKWEEFATYTVFSFFGGWLGLALQRAGHLGHSEVNHPWRCRTMVDGRCSLVCPLPGQNGTMAQLKSQAKRGLASLPKPLKRS